MSRYILTSRNSKFIVTNITTEAINSTPDLIVSYFIGNNVFPSFRIVINVLTSSTRAELINTKTGAVISTATLGNLLPSSSSIVASSSAVNANYDLMFSICGKTLNISARNSTVSGSDEASFTLATASFGTPVTFTNSLVETVNQLSVEQSNFLGFIFRPEYGINPQCSQTPVFDQSTFTTEDYQTLIAAIVIGVVAFIIALALLITYLVQAYPPYRAVGPEFI